MALGQSRPALAFVFIFLLALMSCDETDPAPSIDADFDIQGHRGFRAMYPENGIRGFIEAVNIGVTTLEMDVVVSKDSQIVVSHEATFSADICSNPDGTPITEAGEDSLNIYQLDLVDIQAYDCGLRGNPSFPQQQQLNSVKPSLLSVIDSVEAYVASQSQNEMSYNIEIKSSESGDNIRHPDPERFAQLLITLIDSLGVKSRVSVQSFDTRALREIQEQDASVTTVYLVSDGGLVDNLSELGFNPDVYSPSFTLMSEFLVAQVHDRRMEIIPWTVNEQSEMRPLIDLGVDGIITDYPDRLISLIESEYQ